MHRKKSCYSHHTEIFSNKIREQLPPHIVAIFLTTIFPKRSKLSNPDPNNTDDPEVRDQPYITVSLFSILGKERKNLSNLDTLRHGVDLSSVVWAC